MVVGLTTTYATSVYHHWCCELGSRSGRGVQILCEKVWNIVESGVKHHKTKPNMVNGRMEQILFTDFSVKYS